MSLTNEQVTEYATQLANLATPEARETYITSLGILDAGQQERIAIELARIAASKPTSEGTDVQVAEEASEVAEETTIA